MENNYDGRRAENPLDKAARLYESGKRLKEKWTAKAEGMSKEQLATLARVLALVALGVLVLNIIIYFKKYF